MVIELLTFDVEPGDLEAWLAVDERTWTRFLERQDGFVAKQTWVERDQAGVVNAVITWRDEAAWRSIPDAELRVVDEAMGPWRRTPACRVFDLVGPGNAPTE